jgi:hypothetical protein
VVRAAARVGSAKLWEAASESAPAESAVIVRMEMSFFMGFSFFDYGRAADVPLRPLMVEERASGTPKRIDHEASSDFLADDS